MVIKVRRVVTGHNEQGQSVFVIDDIATSVKEMQSMPGLALTDIWETTSAPADNTGDTDAAARPVRLEPPGSGSVFRICEFPPDSVWRSSATDSATAFSSIGARHAIDTNADDPMRHKTSTIDYVIVLQGEIHVVLDTGEKLLKAGDVLVQRGTMHSWSVRGNKPCIVAGILIGAKPHP